MSRYHPRNLLDKEPVVIAAAVQSAANAAVLFGLITVSAEQLAGANVALVALLALFTRQSVTPNVKV